jgi:hypothetical protein
MDITGELTLSTRSSQWRPPGYGQQQASGSVRRTFSGTRIYPLADRLAEKFLRPPTSDAEQANLGANGYS